MLPHRPSIDVGHPIWFPAKRYGWGWGLPITWQGWTVLAVWLLVVNVGAAVLAGRSWVGFAAFMIVTSGLLICVCYARGEKPRWRWGE